MARNRKVRVDRLIILILSFLLIIGVFGFGIYKLATYLLENKKQNSASDDIGDVITQTSQGIRVSLNDYSIYYDENDSLGFNFIIAEFNFSSNEAISFDLKDLQTSEKITLNDVSKYINTLETNGYDISKLQINTNGVKSSENSANVKLFIPYETDSSNLTIYNLSDVSNKINIDLSKDGIAATTLKLKDDNDVVEVGSTSVYVSKTYISSFMLHNEEPIEIGSTQKYYTFEINVKQSSEKIKITDAKLILNNSNEEYEALSSDNRSIDTENILNKNLNTNSKGGLFFLVNSPSETILEGTLLIKFSSSDNWIEITENTNE